MRFGVNYTPSAGWFHSWLDFSPSAVAADMERIASLGVDHVRIFPLWPLVQPNRTLIRPSAIADIVQVVDIAASFGLDVNVDALQGHLSSFDFIPSWLESWHRRNIFVAPEVITSTATYVRELTSAVASRPNLLGVTLGNELNQFAHDPHPTPHRATEKQASAWLASMVGAVRAELGSTPAARAPLVTVAQYDAAWYDDAQPFGPEHAADYGDLTVTHSWVFNGAAQLHGPLGEGSARHAEYLMQLAAAWNRDANRLNWLQEVGAPTNVVPVKDAPEFLEKTIRHAADVQNNFGVTWWCSHDVSRKLADFPELEYDLGLFTNDGVLKPTGERFAELVHEFRNAKAGAGTPPRDALILEDVDAAGVPVADVRKSCAPGGRFSQAWLHHAASTGRGPQVVLRSKVADALLLAARGITEVHVVPAGIDRIELSIAHPATHH
ncbi:glycoside hydrolase 5 family protein [Arthrobacter dokdonensis]|uniref:glycoside hydrolase 5 family protein n=1 Tax=Arthrobacter dokdonellae TaxID=2211210 RepID=UPI000DE5B652|nr:glycosyl hydrolase [Arthrobacter dokdonellae]